MHANPPSEAEYFSESNTGGYFIWDESACRLACHLNSPSLYWMALKLAASVAAWRAGGLFLHAAGLARDGIAVLALAVSGGGKSTFTDFTPEFSCLSDEAIVVLPGVGGPIVQGTCFRSASRRPPGLTEARLGALLFLEKCSHPSYDRLDARAVPPRLLAQVFRPPKAAAPTRDLLRRTSQLFDSIPAYRFRIPKAPAASLLLTTFFDNEIQR